MTSSVYCHNVSFGVKEQGYMFKCQRNSTRKQNPQDQAAVLSLFLLAGGASLSPVDRRDAAQHLVSFGGVYGVKFISAPLPTPAVSHPLPSLSSSTCSPLCHQSAIPSLHLAVPSSICRHGGSGPPEPTFPPKPPPTSTRLYL